MAEIKSTLELAMERIKKISISDEEKLEIKKKELEEKVNSLFHPYIEGRVTLNEILKEIERMDEKTASAVKESLLSQWIDALSLNGESERLLKGIESLKFQSIDDIKQRFFSLLSQYQKEKEKVRQELSNQMAEALRREGIYGSAVEPNIEVGDLLKSKLEELSRLYGVKLEEIQKQLRVL